MSFFIIIICHVAGWDEGVAKVKTVIGLSNCTVSGKKEATLFWTITLVSLRGFL